MVEDNHTVFISYRRKASGDRAHLVYRDLTQHGYDVFMDVASGHSGPFETMLLDEIARRRHFVLILTPDSVQGLERPGDWLRREIEHAIKTKRNIVPLLSEDFHFDDSTIRSYFTGALSELPRYGGVKIEHDYLDAALERLRVKFLQQPSAEPARPAQPGPKAIPRWFVGVVAATLVLAVLSVVLWRTWPFRATDTPTPTGSIRISRVWPSSGTTLSQGRSVTASVKYSLSSGEGELGLELILFTSPDCSTMGADPEPDATATPLIGGVKPTVPGEVAPENSVMLVTSQSFQVTQAFNKQLDPNPVLTIPSDMSPVPLQSASIRAYIQVGEERIEDVNYESRCYPFENVIIN